MNEKSIDIQINIKSEKTEEIIESKTKSKKTSFSSSKRLFNKFIKCDNCFSYLINKLNFYLSKCSMLIHFPLFLVPISILMILLILSIHIGFYSDLYSFNFSKAFKEEFFDLYMTKIDDFKTELTTNIVKETKIDIENQLFFQVYYKELASAGLMNEDKSYFHSFYENPDSASFFSKLNNINNIDVNFNIPEDMATEKIEQRYSDKLGNFAKIYYYMFPYIWYESLQTNLLINQSFFIAYEVCDTFTLDLWTFLDLPIKGIFHDFLFFRYPKKSNDLEIDNNFSPNDYLLNPYVETYDVNRYFYDTENYTHYYFYLNWFKPFDYEFRSLINNTKSGHFTNISFAHLNQENDRNINKSFIIYSQQYIEQDNRDYIFNIIFFSDQINLKEGDNDYTIFIVKNNLTGILGDETAIEKFTDNESYVVSKSHITEFALSEIDYKFFHVNLYENRNNFYVNGISYDSFNLEYFYDYSKIYATSKDGDYDLKFYVALYLYKSLLQNIEYTKVKKNREQIFLFNFKKDKKIKQICEKINFNSYRNYLSNSGIDCWNIINKKYYSEENYLYIRSYNDSNSIDQIYPYCSCLPLYCLKNYEDLDEDLDNLEFVDNINLPNKCQNKFLKYESFTSDTQYTGNVKIKNSLDISSNMIDYEYMKFITLELNQLPGYFLFVISQIKTSGEVYIHTYYKYLTKMEIRILVLVVLFIASILSIILICINIKKYSLIISNFKNKFEFYAFHSGNEDESNLINGNNIGKYNTIKEDKKKDEQLINIFNINENNLLDDLFVIFCQAYNICIKDIEKLYSSKKHKSKNEMKLNMMIEKNELFKLLAIFCLYAPFFKLNLNFDYDMYKFSEIIKKYNNYFKQLENIDKEQVRLTRNILYELISCECTNEYGLITNFNFGYITNIKADLRKNSIKYTIFENIKNAKNRKLKEEKKENDLNNEQNTKLILKKKYFLLSIFEYNFETDDYLNYNKLNNAFNFFLINSYYKYSRQISLENILS